MNPRLFSLNPVRMNVVIGDSISAMSAFTLAKASFLQRTLSKYSVQRTGSLGVSIVLKAVYDIIIWQLLMNLYTIPDAAPNRSEKY